MITKHVSRSAVVFPGQGSQTMGMGRDVADRSERARQVYVRANQILGFDLAHVCWEGPPQRLEQTDVQQPAIFVTSVAIWEAFLEAGGNLKQFSCAAGLSLGEYTALHVAGALEFDDALRLVHRRGQLMQEAAAASPSGMVSLVGADEKIARALCDRAREGEVLGPANFNCPGQIVISGARSACDRAMAFALEFHIRAVSLAVAGAFHSPLMASAAEKLAPLLEATPIKKPAIPVLANVDGEPHGEPRDIRAFLRRQITEPVLWQLCVERMLEEGIDRFVEMGPGRVLTGLIRKVNRGATCVNVSTHDGLAAAVGAAGVM